MFERLPRPVKKTCSTEVTFRYAVPPVTVPDPPEPFEVRSTARARSGNQVPSIFRTVICQDCCRDCFTDRAVPLSGLSSEGTRSEPAPLCRLETSMVADQDPETVMLIAPKLPARAAERTSRRRSVGPRPSSFLLSASSLAWKCLRQAASVKVKVMVTVLLSLATRAVTSSMDRM